MKNPFAPVSAAERLLEDELYTRVYEELENKQVDKAAQARAIEDGGEDDSAVKKAYVKHRIARIKAEMELFKEKAAMEFADAQKAKEDAYRQAKKDEERKQIEMQTDDNSEALLQAMSFTSGNVLIAMLVIVFFLAVAASVALK